MSTAGRWNSAAATSGKAANSVNWGDVEGDDEPLASPSSAAASSSSSSALNPVVPVVSSTKVDAKGIKTVVEFGTNAQGEKIKITRKIKVSQKPVRVNRHVLERQNWEKFGDCKGLPRGPEQNITYQSFEIIHLDLRAKKREEQKEESSLDKLANASSIVVCRNCGETGHWTLKCPKRQTIQAFAKPGDNGSGPDVDASATPVSGTGSKYVPMHLRGEGGARGVSSLRGGGPDDAYTLRVTNLSEDVTEQDLQDLFRRFGHTSRLYLARDRQTGESRGFAFVNFSNRQDAENAIAKLDGHGYANLILHVEWAQPRGDKEKGDN